MAAGGSSSGLAGYSSALRSAGVDDSSGGWRVKKAVRGDLTRYENSAHHF
jgi:hypothetical protein